MTNLKSEHLWPIVEQTREHCFSDALGVPNFVAWAMLDDLHTLREELDRLNAELEAGQTFLVPNALTDEQRAMWKEFYGELNKCVESEDDDDEQ